MTNNNNKQRFLAVVGCNWNDGEVMLGILRSLPNAEVIADEDLVSFTVRFDAASLRGAKQVLRRVRMLGFIPYYSRVATQEELAA